MFSKSTAFTVSAFAAAVAAHGTVTGIVADDVYYRGFRLEDYYTKANGGALPSVPGWYAENLDNGFIAPSAYATSDINCHKNAAPGAATATVAAGGKVDFQWTAWPESHVGPILTYVAKCTGDCSSADKTTLEWVKIDEAAYNYDQSKWEVLNMIANNNTWSVTVPSTLAAGNYVFRHEIIALHSAGSEDGAQNYPQCLNIAVTGSGTESPAGTLGTELYKSTDAGILVNIYTTITDYVIPGPGLFGSGSSSGSGSGAASSAPAASSPAAASSSPAAVSSAAPQITSSPSSTPAASTPVAAAASSSPSSSSAAAATSAPVPTVTAAPVPTQAISAIGQLTTAIPSELLTGALPTAVPTAGTPGSSGDLPSTPLPEGMTLKDLLDWIQYILKNYFKNGGHGRGRKHARAF